LAGGLAGARADPAKFCARGRDPGHARPAAHAQAAGREQASHIQRRQKTLEDANLKLSSVLTNIMGLTGRAILEALISGHNDLDHLLTLIDRRVKAPPETLRAALQGRINDRHRFLLEQYRIRWNHLTD